MAAAHAQRGWEHHHEELRDRRAAWDARPAARRLAQVASGGARGLGYLGAEAERARTAGIKRHLENNMACILAERARRRRVKFEGEGQGEYSRKKYC